MRVLIGLTLLAVSLAAPADVSRWVDGKGVVHYGDTPPREGVRPVELPPLQTYSPQAVDPATLIPVAPAGAAATKASVPRLIAPQAGETVRGNGITVTVEVDLQASEGLLYFLDGVQQNASATASLAYLIDNVERGEHTVSATVVNAAGQERGRTPTITVYMKPPIVLPSRPAPASR